MDEQKRLFTSRALGRQTGGDIMNKRIFIGLTVALLLLVVTAAYAPYPGPRGKGKPDQPELAEEAPAEKLDTTLENTEKLDTLLENQKTILDKLKSLEETQEEIKADIKWIRSRV